MSENYRHTHAREPQLLKPKGLEPVLCNKRNHHSKKPRQRSSRKSARSNDPEQPKIIKKKENKTKEIGARLNLITQSDPF